MCLINFTQFAHTSKPTNLNVLNTLDMSAVIIEQHI
jgi:hypothetical protein